MGCYMSKPNDEVHVTEGKGRNFTYATTSCQGWRREQEDAEACIPNFDDDASLFILCDGHGGAEVAEYTVKHFPDFLKNHPLYKEGQYEKALERAFIDFDATLRTEEVMNEITKMAFDNDKVKENEDDADSQAMDCKEEKPAGSSSSSTNVAASGSSSGSGAASSSSARPSTSNGASSVADDVDTDTLRREAQLPIEELISKYANQESKSRILTLKQASLAYSPVIKSKDEKKSDLQNPEASSSTNEGGDQPEPSSSKPPEEGPSSTSNINSLQDVRTNLDIFKKAMEQYFDEDENSEDDSEFDGLQDSDSDEDDDDEEDDDDDDDEDDEEEDDDDDGDDERDEDTLGEKSKSKKLLNKKQRRSTGNSRDSSSEDEDSDDYEDIEDEEEDDENDGEEEEDAEDDDGGIIDGNFLQRKLQQNLKASKVHRPVMDSGCTVVVALIKGKTLYVASAGDSRCIVIPRRDGLVKALSHDHKPEDPIELRRIKKAGGQVVEGRVNGGLNLSRAFGDFTYKSAALAAENQMITPLPDVTTLEADPDEFEFIFLACDGIWNSMHNQQVNDFIKETAGEVDNDLVGICMAILKSCLAPGTDGDGTGCDNMTCILVRYTDPNEKKSSTTNQSDLKTPATNDENSTNELSTREPQKATKRSAGEDSGDNDRNKRRCLRLLED